MANVLQSCAMIMSEMEPLSSSHLKAARDRRVMQGAMFGSADDL